MTTLHRSSLQRISFTAFHIWLPGARPRATRAAITVALSAATLASLKPSRTSRTQSALLDFAAFLGGENAVLGRRCYSGVPLASTPAFESTAWDSGTAIVTAPDQVRIDDVTTDAPLWNHDQLRVGIGSHSWSPGVSATDALELQWGKREWGKRAAPIGLARVAYTRNTPGAFVPARTSVVRVEMRAASHDRSMHATDGPDMHASFDHQGE